MNGKAMWRGLVKVDGVVLETEAHHRVPTVLAHLVVLARPNMLVINYEDDSTIVYTVLSAAGGQWAGYAEIAKVTP